MKKEKKEKKIKTRNLLVFSRYLQEGTTKQKKRKKKEKKGKKKKKKKGK